MIAVGSMCSGYGGLELGLAQAGLSVEVAWHAEVDADADAVLAARWPGVPNLGDIRAFDWADAQPVDVVCAGFPCQPVSLAGRRHGINDERWLFDDIMGAVGAMAARPRWIVLENVPGLLTANGGAAMGRVISGLAHGGYVGCYRVRAAADVGACHRRRRLFIVARDAAHPAGAGEVLAEPCSGGQADSGRPSTEPRGRHSVDRRWGEHAEGVARWASIVGRPAPWPPTIGRQVNARLPEWMMGLPDGWVTDVLPNLRAGRVIGNGVCPQQAAEAIRPLWRLMCSPASTSARPPGGQLALPYHTKEQQL